MFCIGCCSVFYFSIITNKCSGRSTTNPFPGSQSVEVAQKSKQLRQTSKIYMCTRERLCPLFSIIPTEQPVKPTDMQVTTNTSDKLHNYYYIKDDFQSVLHTLERLFAFFVSLHVRHHKMLTFCNYLREVNSKFQNNYHYGCEAVKALGFVLSHIT